VSGSDEKTPAESRDEKTHKAREAELRRQERQVEAVAKAHDELPKLGGPMLQPGLGR
jgi:hypothetical protein